MKRLILLIIGIIFSSFLFCQTPEGKLKISHLTGDYYIFTTYKSLNGTIFPANGMYVVTENGIVLIDTPWDTTQFQPFCDSILKRHNKKVILCLATHFHDDRTGGFDFFKGIGAKTYSSKQTFDLCKASLPKTFPYSNTSKHY